MKLPSQKRLKDEENYNGTGELIMFFRRKGWLRKEFDEKLLSCMDEYKKDWQQQKALLEKSFDPSEEVICQTKLAEVKYFFLLKEAKQRNITLKRY
jgi:hypothetical protein